MKLGFPFSLPVQFQSSSDLSSKRIWFYFSFMNIYCTGTLSLHNSYIFNAEVTDVTKYPHSAAAQCRISEDKPNLENNQLSPTLSMLYTLNS